MMKKFAIRLCAMGVCGAMLACALYAASQAVWLQPIEHATAVWVPF